MSDDVTGRDAADPRFSALPGRPGKILAVHLSYASRADQRGRRPSHPSYFLKPSSSVAASGGTVERPAGTELLAFEGEIALVIGTAARRVGLEDAWDHVAWVTASNDLGLYDLRANDRGSNLRSKGGDGFTPVGPGLIDARAVDPGALRVRTWVNGELRQDDTTAGLLFPLAQLVADLSQHVTLEPGDIVLTGTPAGSSVVVPGDVVEVEVDAPGTPGAPSSGRLVTTVTQGERTFDEALGSLPAVDDTQRAEAWGSRGAAGLAPAPEPFRLTPELREKLLRAPTAGLSAQLRRRGLNAVTIDGVRPMHPGTTLVGTARTLRFVPAREDLFARRGGGYNAQKQAFDSVGEGDVLVIDARGETGSGTFGDVLALRAHARGAAGIVTDGGVRDHDAVAAVGIPVYSAGAHPAVLGRRHVPWDVDVAVACGGTTVEPGRRARRRRGRRRRDPAGPRRGGRRRRPGAGGGGRLDRRAGVGGPPAGGAVPDGRDVADPVRGPRGGPVSGATTADSKSQRAYHALRARIAGQELAPGYRLVLAPIADELGMSVVPVREAIRRLEAEGLVTFERNVGARVSMIDDTGYRHSMETLALLEGSATALAARHLTADDVRRARELNRQLVESLEHFDPRLFTELNHRFHAVLFAACPNPRLLALVEAEWVRLGHLRDSTFSFVPGRAQESVREHEGLVDLVEAGAPLADIERAARAHRSGTLAAYLSHERPDDAPVPAGVATAER